MRSVPSLRASFARAAVFMSASIRSASMSFSIKGPARTRRAGPGTAGVIQRRQDYIMPFRAFFRARFFAASAFFLRLTDGFS